MWQFSISLLWSFEILWKLPSIKITALTILLLPGNKNWHFPGIIVTDMEPATKEILPCSGASWAHWHRLGECFLWIRKDEFHLWHTVLVSLSMTDISALLEQKSQWNSCKAGPSSHCGVISSLWTLFLRDSMGEVCKGNHMLLSGSLVESLKFSWRVARSKRSQVSQKYPVVSGRVARGGSGSQNSDLGS